MSHNLTVPLLLLYTKILHSMGWNSAAVMTSVSSSMFVGLMSTISIKELKNDICNRSLSVQVVEGALAVSHRKYITHSQLDS